MIRPALLWLLWTGLACAGARQSENGAGGGAEIEGVLHVIDQRAYLERNGERISLIRAPAQTASSHTSLMAETASDLKPLDGSWVRARGSRQGSVLWDAVVTPTRRSR